MWLKEKKLLNKVCPNCINSFLKSWGGHQISHLSSDVRSFFSHKKKWIGNLQVSVKWSHNHCFLLPPLSAQSHKPGSSIDTTVLRPLSKHFMSAQYPITVSSSEVTQRFQYNQGSPFFTQRGQLFCQLWRCSQQAMLHIVSCTSTLTPFTPTCDTWFWFFLFFFSPFLYFFFSLPIFFFFLGNFLDQNNLTGNHASWDQQQRMGVYRGAMGKQTTTGWLWCVKTQGSGNGA